MTLKGSLASFGFPVLDKITVDERRELRTIALQKLGNVKIPPRSFVEETLVPIFVTERDTTLIKAGFPLIEDFYKKLTTLAEYLKKYPGSYEVINIKRLKDTIDEIPKPLQHNINEMDCLLNAQSVIVDDVYELLQKISIASKSDLKEIGKLSFEKLQMLANNDAGTIQPELRINEAQREHIIGVNEGYKKGYILKKSMEEELKKIPFQYIYDKLTIEQKTLFKEMETLLQRITDIVELAYQLNWKQIALIRKTYCILSESMNNVSKTI